MGTFAINVGIHQKSQFDESALCLRLSGKYPLWQSGLQREHCCFRNPQQPIHNNYSHFGPSPCMLISVVLSDAGTAARVNTVPVPTPDRDLKN